MSGIDLSRSPYFDDFNANDNYYQVMFRPSVAVQTRELNQVQSVLQDQVSKFGRHIFKEGSVTEGCAFSFDKNYSFVKINDNYSNGTAFIITDFQDRYIINKNGLEAVIVNTLSGYEAQDPDVNTLYIKYLTSAVYSNGVQQTVFDNSEELSIITSDEILIGNVLAFTPNTFNNNSVSTGYGYAFTTSEGVVYKNGYFVNVRPQTIIVDKYNNYPDGISVGFSVIENIITPEANTSLYDNAIGSPNYSAPGAHRYQIIPNLITMQTNNITNSTPFFSLCDFQSGAPITIKNDPQYNILGAEMARRTYETNGDYIVNPFVLTTEPKSVNDPLFAIYDNLICSRGLGYVKGYRNEFLNNVTVPIAKSTDFSNTFSITTASFGYFVNVFEYAGDFKNVNISKVELHSVAKKSISTNSFLSAPYSSSTIIGYCYLRGFKYNSGPIGTGLDQYSAYLFNIEMLPGFSFSQVQSLIIRGVNQNLAVADVIRTGSTTSERSTTVITPVTRSRTDTITVTNNIIKTITNLVAEVTEHATPNGYWTTVAPLPAAVALSAAARSAGTIVFVGGLDSSGGGLSTSYAYDIASNAWFAGPTLPQATYEPCLQLVGPHKMMLFGGVAIPQGGPTASCYFLDTNSGAWSAAPSLPAKVVQHASACLSNGSVLSIGGLTRTTNTSPYVPVANTFRFDPGLNAWTQVASLPHPICSISATTLANGSVVVVGGDSVTGSPRWIYANTYCYDPVANSWTYLRNPPKSLLEVQAATLANGCVLAFSGLDMTTSQMISAAYIYDPVTDLWSNTGSLPKAFFQATSEPVTLANGCILSMGGRTSATTFSNITDCFLYDPVITYWTSTDYVPVTTEEIIPVTSSFDVTSSYTQNVISTSLQLITSPSTQGIQTSYNMMIFPLGQKALKIDGFSDQSYVYRTSAISTFSDLVSGKTSISIGAPIGSAIEIFDYGGFLTSGAEESFIIIPTSGGSTNYKAGNVYVTANGFVVNGFSTSFTTDYNKGDYIFIGGVTSQINSISNDTFMALTSPYSSSSQDSVSHYKIFPPGVPIDFTKQNRSIDISSNTAIFTLGESLSSAFNAVIYFDVLRGFTTPIKKVLCPSTYVAINCSSHPNGTVGPWSLGFVDVLGINAIYVNDDSFSNMTPDSSSLFLLDNGQRDDHYELASISMASSAFTSNTRILIDLMTFTYDQSQGVGFFNANSYPIDDVNYANTNAIMTSEIPQYISSVGTNYDLRDCIDFRPFANNSANAQANSINWDSSATINPSSNLIFSVNPTRGSFMPSPDTNYMANIEYYLPRIDKAILSSDGQLKVLEGIPALHPIAPIDSSTAMTLGIISVPPYPSLSTPEAKAVGRYDYAITIGLTQNKRYTMRDINTLSQRINQLEYYTSLNLLEQSAQSLLITTGSTGQNRFQNGFLADPFVGFDISDTLDPTFNCTIDSSNGELRPAISTFTKAIWTDQSDLPFNTSDYIYQNYSSDTVNCSSTAYNYHGRVEFYPQLFCSPDYFYDPDVVNNLSLESAWVNISCRPSPDLNDYRNPYGTDWGHWRHYSNLNNVNGAVDNGYQTRNINLVKSSSYLNSSNNAFVSDGIQLDTNVVDYTRQKDIMFIARGLKPNTKVRLLCGTYDLTSYCRQCSKGFAEETFSNYNNNFLSCNESGYIYGKITIPPACFKEGSLQFTFCDDPDNITTRADGYCHTTFTDQNNWKDIDLADQIGNYGYFTGVGSSIISNSQIVVLNNTSFLNIRQVGDNNLLTMTNYFKNHGNQYWQRYPAKTGITFPADDDWNPAYVAKEGFHSVDRKGQDISRITYGVVPKNS